MTSARLTLLAACAASISFPALADAPPPQVQKLLDCQGIADSGARLACFDSAAAAVRDALDKQDLVVADRPQIRKARRSIFGLNLPDVADVFGSRGSKMPKGGEENVDEIEATVAHASHISTVGWVLTLDDGAQWTQIDTRELARDPHPGSKIRIRRAMMGSFLANIDGQIAIRVKRAR